MVVKDIPKSRNQQPHPQRNAARMEDPSHHLLVPLLQNYPLTPRFFASIALQSKKTSDGNTTSEDVASGLLGLAGTGNDDVGGLGLRLGLGTRAGVDGSLRAGGRSGLGVLAADRSDRVDDSASLFVSSMLIHNVLGGNKNLVAVFLTSTTVQGQSVMVRVVASVMMYFLWLNSKVVGSGQYVTYSSTTRVVVAMAVPFCAATKPAAAATRRAVRVNIFADLVFVWGVFGVCEGVRGAKKKSLSE